MKQSAPGIKVLELRIKKGLTQKELAELCNVDIRTIQRIESGEVVPGMHTVRLLSKVLGYDINCTAADIESSDPELNKQLKLAYISGIIFSINYLAVVYNLITQSLSFSLHTVTIFLHTVSYILFCSGFFVLGKFYKNQILMIASSLSMILISLINLNYLLKSSYLNFFMSTSVFALVCITAICSGIGLVLEGIKRKNNKINIYKIAGVILVIQSILFISLKPGLINSGLIISITCNLVMIKILYMEFTVWKLNKKYTGDFVIAQ